MSLNLGSLLKTAGPVVGKAALSLKKVSPEILLGAGIIGFVATNVMSSRASLKLDEKLKTMEDDVIEVKVKHIEKVTVETEVLEEQGETVFSKTEYHSDLTKVYVKHSFHLFKLYLPSITLGGLSIAALLGSHTIMRNRNVALMAAYQTVSTAYSKYRDLVTKTMGEEAEEKMRRDSLVIETEKKDEDGKKEIVVSKVVDPNGYSPYAKFFDEMSVRWEKDPNYNLHYLRAQQSYFTDMLRARGHVLLNEVYDALGIPRTKAGAIVGWTLSKDGDNYIDFGIYDLNSPSGRAFVNGEERSILLDFNVDGVIYDQLED